MRAHKERSKTIKVEEKPIVKVEEPIEEILPIVEEKVSTKPKRKKTLLELIEEEEENEIEE